MRSERKFQWICFLTTATLVSTSTFALTRDSTPTLSPSAKALLKQRGSKSALCQLRARFERESTNGSGDQARIYWNFVLQGVNSGDPVSCPSSGSLAVRVRSATFYTPAPGTSQIIYPSGIQVPLSQRDLLVNVRLISAVEQNKSFEEWIPDDGIDQLVQTP